MAPYSSAVSAGADINASDVNNVRKDLLLGARNNQEVTASAVAVGGVVTLDLSNVDNGNVKVINLDQSITLRFSGITKYPTVFFVRFKNDATGGYTVTIDQDGVNFPAQTAPTISTGANEITGLMFIVYSATDWDCYPAGFGLLEP